MRGGREITAEYPASSFNWTRVSGDAAADAAWNASHAGMKQIALTPADTVSGVEFRCTYSETEGSYGTVQVDGAMTAHHTPAVEDANDAFALVDGVLTVTTDSENGSDYAVDGNTLIVNSGFTGTITSTVTVTDGARTREIDFIYDHNGLRTGKVVTEGEKTETTEYTLHGKLITHMTKRCVDEYGAETVQNLHFFYDAQSRPAFVEYNGTKYRYLHNLQGDIVGIVDNNGNLVVEYKYDAWGKPISVTGSMADTLGKQNPFRYRGYVYDEETGLHYLRSRYYNPVIGRFVNSDTLCGILAALMSHNGFAYCLNMPVMLADHNGRVPGSVTKIRGALLDVVKQRFINMVNWIAQRSYASTNAKMVSYRTTQKYISKAEQDNHNDGVEDVVKWTDRILVGIVGAGVGSMLSGIGSKIAAKIPEKLLKLASTIGGVVVSEMEDTISGIFVDAFSIKQGSYTSICATFQYSHKHLLFLSCDNDYQTLEIRNYGDTYYELWISTAGCNSITWIAQKVADRDIMD